MSRTSKPVNFKTVTIAFAMVFSCFLAQAQSRVDAGVISSGRGAGVSIDIYGKSAGEFTTITIAADFHGIVTGKDLNPGIRANVIRNFVINESELNGGGKWLFYGGPGATAGYTRDNGRDFGPVAALSGHIGMSFLYEKITFSLGLTADLGLHLIADKNFTDRELALYKDGILHSMVPEVRLMVPLSGGRNVAGQAPARPSKFIFSVEQGALSTIYEKFDNTYLNSDGARNSYGGKRWSGHINTMMLVSLGFAATDRLTVRLSTGYMGFHEDARDIPALAGLAYSPKGSRKSGILLFLDAGAGFAGSSSRSNDFLSRAGIGKRFMVSGKSSLDINLSAMAAYYKPDKITSRYSGETITGNNILDSGSWLLGPALTVTMNL